MTTLYSARWLLPITRPPIENGALAVDGDRIVGCRDRQSLLGSFPEATVREFGNAAIVPGLINAHSHLELTAMRGFLDSEEGNFSGWLKKLTLARLERMTPDDLYVSAALGACEAARAGITSVGDSSDSADQAMKALHNVGLRGVVFQESFGPDPRLVSDNFQKLVSKVAVLRTFETPLLRAGVSPHAPYTVCAPQLEMTAAFALSEKLPVMMHAAESFAEEQLLSAGLGGFAEGLRKRGIEWNAPKMTTIEYLYQHHILDTEPLLAHCVTVNSTDIDLMKKNAARVAHCPRSNAKLGHRRAPFEAFLEKDLVVGLGSDSVASNNSCDILAESRFAVLSARIASDQGPNSAQKLPQAIDGLRAATLGGARALGLDGVVGELQENRQADFAVISLDGLHQVPSYDPVSTLVFSSSGHDVVLTVVAGREIYERGRMKTIDEDDLRRRMAEIAKKLAS